MMQRLVDLEPIEKAYHEYVNAGGHSVVDALRWLSTALDTAPSYRLEDCIIEEEGDWIEVPLFQLYEYMYRCSKCDVMQREKSRYCPSCGRRMRCDQQ